MTKRRILAFMDFLAPTGLAAVTRNIMERITPFLKEHNIHIDIMGYNMGDQEKVLFNDNIIAYHPKVYAKDMKDPLYRDGFLSMLQKKPYELVWMINDLFEIYPMIPILDATIQMKKKMPGHPAFKTIVYYPIDSIINNKWFQAMDFFDGIYTYTEYGKGVSDLAMSYFENTKDLKAEVIPHGIDTENFKKIDTEGLRAKYALPEDAFIFGTVNKNQPRKDLACTMISFAIFLQKIIERGTDNYKTPVLYIHAHPEDPNGVMLHRLAAVLGLRYGKEYFFPIEDKYNQARYTTQDMNEVYNCMDVFLSTSQAEGWGLTVCEAMAVGLPVICGNHTSLKEIMADVKPNPADRIKLDPHVQIGAGNVVSYKLDTDDVSEEMFKQFVGTYYLLPDYSSVIAKYNWDDIARTWEGIIAKNLKIKI